MIIFGLIGAVYPYQLARFNEQIDAIGSRRRSSEVEPADWYVTLTRIVGIVLVVIGLIATIE